MSAVKLKKLSQIDSVTDNDWYLHPILLSTFLVFLFLFIFSIYALTATGSLIAKSQDMTKQQFKDKYGQEISQIEACYIINTIILIFSVLVLVFFLSKLIKVKSTMVLINDYVGIAFLLFIVFAASYNVDTFNNIQNTNSSSVSSVSAVIIIIAIIGLVFLGLKTFRNHESTK